MNKNLFKYKLCNTILNINVRFFTVTSRTLVDVDKILAQANKQLEEQKEYKEYLDKTFLTEVEEKVKNLINKQEGIEDKIEKRIEYHYAKLPKDKIDPINEELYDDRLAVANKTNAKGKALEAEFPDELKPIAFFVKKVDMEGSNFKKYIHSLEKEENQIDKEIKKTSYYTEHKDEYEKERSEWKEKHIEEIKECRGEKQYVKTLLTSRLEPASQMAEDLLDETGPDYTGGDD